MWNRDRGAVKDISRGWHTLSSLPPANICDPSEVVNLFKPKLLLELKPELSPRKLKLKCEFQNRP